MSGRVYIENLDGLADLIRAKLGVPVLVMVVEGREPVGDSQSAWFTNGGASGVEASASFALAGHMVSHAIETLADKACSCPVCADQLVRLRKAADALGKQLGMREDDNVVRGRFDA